MTDNSASLEKLFSNLRETNYRYAESSQEKFTPFDSATARRHLQIFQTSTAGKVINTVFGPHNPFALVNANSDIKGKLGENGTIMILDEHIDDRNSNRQITLYGPNHPPGIIGLFASFDGKTGTTYDGIITDSMAFGVIHDGGNDIKIPFQFEIRK